MPLFTFICEDCGEKFELIVSLSRLDEVTCPTCESTAVDRQLSRIAGLKMSGGAAFTASAPSSSCAPGGG